MSVQGKVINMYNNGYKLVEIVEETGLELRNVKNILGLGGNISGKSNT